MKNKKHNQYAVHPPTTEFNLNGSPKTPKALCYVEDWYTGFAVLTAYKAGTYEPGMERDLKFNSNPDDAVKRIISDYSKYKNIVPDNRLTFSDVYELYYNDKFVNSKRQYSKSSITAAKIAFKNTKDLHDMLFEEITLNDLQKVIDNCPLKHASLELIKNLFRGMYQYAVPHEITDKDYSLYVKINIPDDDEHGVPFTESDILALWKNRHDITASRLIVMCYTGFRIAAYKDIQKTSEYFMGGIKTKAGKGRIVPIHKDISKLAASFDMSKIHTAKFRSDMYKLLESLGIPKHTPHDCRHTFSMLCDKYNVNPIAKKKMLGHSLANDMSNGVYGHWDYSMLKEEIEKIQVPW